MTKFVEIQLDDNVPDYMNGIIRCGEVKIVNKDGEELENRDDMVDNIEFLSQEEMIESVSNRLSIPKERVIIIE